MYIKHYNMLILVEISKFKWHLSLYVLVQEKDGYQKVRKFLRYLNVLYKIINT